MSRNLMLTATLAAGLVATQAGCTWFKKKTPVQPAPPLPQPQIEVMPPAQIPPPPPAVNLPPSQTEPAVAKPEVEPEPQVIRPKLEKVEPPPKPRARKSTAPKTDATKTEAPKTEPAKTETPAAPPPAATPQENPPESAKPEPLLGEVLSESQRKAYLQTVQENLTQARESLAEVQRKNLTAEQNESAERVRTFIRQAEESKQTDLTAAVQFARRAALLAKDLLQSVK